jgi:glyceraldehyde 3-phosphate dehydrogenase (phosphorylating)
MAIRVGINGFGRIGKNIMRLAQGDSEIKIVHLNDVSDSGTLAHLFKYDEIHGTFPGAVASHTEGLTINGELVRCTSEADPAKIPWEASDCQIILECTGKFRDREKAVRHMRGPVKKVIVSAPGKSNDVTVVMGVNQSKYNPKSHHVISNASCTTNCLAPLGMVLHENWEIICGFMTTVHSYTNDQRVLPGPHKDLRRARAAALNQIPTTTGAAKAIGLVLPELEGKLEGISIRVPTANVSLLDLVVQVQKAATIPKINDVFRKESQGRLKGYLDYMELPLVSSDFNNCRFSATVDGLSTNVVGGKLIKVLAWYDNETGFSQRMVDLTRYIGKDLG